MAKKSGRPAKKSRAKKATKKPVLPKAPAVELPPKALRLPNVWQLTVATGRILWNYKFLFLGLGLVYGIANLILVQGVVNGSDVDSLKNTINNLFNGHLSGLGSGLVGFIVLAGSAGSGGNSTTSAYQLLLILVTSLAVIWSLRQVQTGVIPRIRDAYYVGTYPLVLFMLIILVIGLQLLPLLIGTALYSMILNGGIAITLIEKFICLVIFLGLAWVSFYFITASLFALFIVTLPNMTPMKALQSAKELVHHRRLEVARKVLWLPVALFIAAAIVMVPVIVWLTPLAQTLFFILTMLLIPASNAYLYNLYRELLDEQA